MTAASQQPFAPKAQIAAGLKARPKFTSLASLPGGKVGGTTAGTILTNPWIDLNSELAYGSPAFPNPSKGGRPVPTVASRTMPKGVILRHEMGHATSGATSPELRMLHLENMRKHMESAYPKAKGIFAPTGPTTYNLARTGVSMGAGLGATVAHDINATRGIWEGLDHYMAAKGSGRGAQLLREATAKGLPAGAFQKIQNPAARSAAEHMSRNYGVPIDPMFKPTVRFAKVRGLISALKSMRGKA
jgi:hypothetical protein